MAWALLVVVSALPLAAAAQPPLLCMCSQFLCPGRLPDGGCTCFSSTTSVTCPGGCYDCNAVDPGCTSTVADSGVCGDGLPPAPDGGLGSDAGVGTDAGSGDGGSVDAGGGTDAGDALDGGTGSADGGAATDAGGHGSPDGGAPPDAGPGEVTGSFADGGTPVDGGGVGPVVTFHVGCGSVPDGSRYAVLLLVWALAWKSRRKPSGAEKGGPRRSI